MAGHSKWAKVKHFKGKVDAARSRAFSRCAKEISVAARVGGGDPNFNPRLRTAIAAARAENMPNDNIDRAVRRGTGELEGVAYEESIYEGYAPGGVAVVVEVLTDNKNRAAAEIRSIFTRHGGNLAAQGAVVYLFQRRGLVVVPRAQIGEDDLMEIVLDAGAEDLRSDEDQYEVITPVDALDAVLEALRKEKVEPSSGRLAYLPQMQMPVNEDTAARKVLDLVEDLDGHDDVQHVYANFDIPEAILEKAC